MEGTLGHSRKALDHRIRTELLVGLGVPDHIEAVGEKNAAQKCVYQIDLHEHVDEVEDLTDHEVKKVPFKWKGLIKKYLSNRCKVLSLKKYPYLKKNFNVLLTGCSSFDSASGSAPAFSPGLRAGFRPAPDSGDRKPDYEDGHLVFWTG